MKAKDKINFEPMENMLLQVFWNHLWSETENSGRTRGNRHKKTHMKFHPNTRKPFFPVRVLKGWQQVGRRGAVSNSRDILNPTSQDPGQPAQEVTAGPDDLNRSHPTSTIL